jgi:hypothetical protein
MLPSKRSTVVKDMAFGEKGIINPDKIKNVGFKNLVVKPLANGIELNALPEVVYGETNDIDLKIEEKLH